jgi:glutamine cyclotransferase
MKTKFIFYFVLLAIVYGCNSCKTKSSGSINITPEAGTSLKAGDALPIKVSFSADFKPDSVVYLLDSARFATRKDSSVVNLKTDTMGLGIRTISARVFQGGKLIQEVSTNVVLLAAKAPEEYTFKIEKVFPHDTSAFTEGLVYQDGFLYESSGGYINPPPGQANGGEGQSNLRKVDLNTGKVIKKVMNEKSVFAEGISIVGNKLIQLTWHEKVGYVYDRDSFKLLSTFTNNTGIEGWGMTFDGNKLYMDDSSNRIWFLNKDNYHAAGYINVCDDKQQINEINELEFIDGKIYANVWEKDFILAIDPKTGVVLQRIDMSALYPKDKRNSKADVLNGIAYDKSTGRIFVTGKKWDKLFQVKFVKKG